MIPTTTQTSTIIRVSPGSLGTKYHNTMLMISIEILKYEQSVKIKIHEM